MSVLVDPSAVWAPAVEVRIDGAGLAADVSANLTDVQITLEADAIDQATLTFANPFPQLRFTHGPAARLFAEGSGLVVRLGYTGNVQTLFDGEVTSIAPSFPAAGHPTVQVEASSRLHRLTAPPRSDTYPNVTDGQVARRVAQRNNLTPDVSEAPGATTHPVLTQHNQDDLTFLRARARAIGYELTVEGTTLRYAPAADAQPASRLLVWGQPQMAMAIAVGFARPLLRFDPRLNPRRPVTGVKVRGRDPLTAEPIEGTAGDAATLPTLGMTAAEVARRAFGGDREQVVTDQPVLSQQEADTLATALYRDLAQQLVSATAGTVGDPDLRPGRTVEVAGVGPRFSGTYYVTRAVHSTGAAGYRTTLTLRRGEVGPQP
jgi:Bacteriophage probable baseplate hub protein